MALGAYMASAFPDLAAHAGVGIAELFGRGRLIAAFLIILNLIQVNVMTMYSGYMSSITIISGARGARHISLRVKFLVMTVLMTITTVTALATQDNFDVYFSDLLAILMYVLVPWSAINLADYYVVTKGSYPVDQMFSIHGIYGAFRWSSIGVYLLSIALQIPFMSLSFYSGPVARLVGADIAWLPGTLIPTVLYILVERSRAEPVGARVTYPQSP
jgi:NCS1 family nucleobase:cation symporter-1